ncbi:GrpB family protein [Chitinophaga qingshengii]|uniref:GrpB family protein n=1 Tax=Chitinophaga qingshengii TaxID=1569794 RepID=A0ABR7TII5_9BACT|nr:GrpB family protein [Chitinophaga qingshengii]MBC9930259.1 GrpB family protein [Chitinophaga qingshengii]
MEQRTITVVPYNTAWADTFEQLAAIYRAQLGKLTTGIEHVGSTSVPGLPAKPILDIDILISQPADLPPVVAVLEQLGYTWRGDLGIPGREAFGRNDDGVPRDGSGTQWPAHHLYVCLEGCTSLKNHLQLRNYLRQHPEAVRQYGRLKQELAAKYPNDIDSYVEGKTAFITAILAHTGMEANALQDITAQNKATK